MTLDLTSQELEQTLELLWVDAGCGRSICLTGPEHVVERVKLPSGWVELTCFPNAVLMFLMQEDVLPSAISTKSDKSWRKIFKHRDVLNYFVNLKRLRNLRALVD